MKRLRRDLLRWYRAHRRDLPWRHTRDPYAIWISETMLQQTRVDTVIPYYERFLARFPTVQCLADADADELMEHWAGLGYYSRARNLHAAAQTVVSSYAGTLPDEEQELQQLKGIGRYTAGAIASIAFDRPAPVLDGNVMRVLARVLDLHEDIRLPATQEKLWKEAGNLVQGDSPGDLNQGLMELGALVCTPKTPRCGKCPIQRHCAAHANETVALLPIKSKAVRVKKIRAVCGYLLRRGKVLATRRPPTGLLGSLWELPGDDLDRTETPEEGLLRALQERTRLMPLNIENMGTVKHVFTHRRLTLHVLRGELADGRVQRYFYDAHRWCTPRKIRELPLSTVAHKALDAAEREA